MLFSLALIPVVGLLFFIYFKDRKEKEPFRLLVALFFAGMGTSVTAIIAENIGQTVLEVIFPYTPVLKALALAIFIVAPAEELGKFLVLRLITWKNRHFNYSYDAIVYAVFVSLGFAALENVGYVFSSGIVTAVVRMFTAVPGHACYAVFMGFFYSKAKDASITGKSGKCFINILLSIIVPILIHGVYDAILMGANAIGEDVAIVIGVVLWIVFVIVLFIVSIIIIIYSSKHDYCIVNVPEQGQTIYRPGVVGGWTCSCGTQNYFNYCARCGNHRPVNNIWHCPRCRTLSTYKFCGNCGCPKPVNQYPADQPPVMR